MARAELATQVETGFPRMGEMDALLREFESHRDAYPTMRSFMPRIVSVLRDYALNR